MYNIYERIKNIYNTGILYLNNDIHIEAKKKSLKELKKLPSRTEIINFILQTFNKTETSYLEIGVKNPNDNFNKIQSIIKYSVDPGIEFKENPVDYKLTSDVFFEKLRKGEILNQNVNFDVIFIDGLHLAEQVERDLTNSLDFISNDGFVILHDCNPPTEFHSRETYGYFISPATCFWNGTTWKTFFKYRQRNDIYSCCIDTDWGVGIISKKINLGKPTVINNPFYEFKILNENRKDSLNLIDFEEFKILINK